MEKCDRTGALVCPCQLELQSWLPSPKYSHTTMPTFSNIHQMTTHGGEFNDMTGDNNRWDNNIHTTYMVNSHNTIRHTATDSYNDSSKRYNSTLVPRKSFMWSHCCVVPPLLSSGAGSSLQGVYIIVMPRIRTARINSCLQQLTPGKHQRARVIHVEPGCIPSTIPSFPKALSQCPLQPCPNSLRAQNLLTR